MKEPVTLTVTIQFMNGDSMKCPGVRDYSLNQVALQLIYEHHTTRLPVCNIKAFTMNYSDGE